MNNSLRLKLPLENKEIKVKYFYNRVYIRI